MSLLIKSVVLYYVVIKLLDKIDIYLKESENKLCHIWKI